MSDNDATHPPRVFISYSHDSPEHCDRVLALAQQLRRDGIDIELDQYHQQELVHWPRWCEEQLRPENSDFVLCVCTEEYKRRVEGRVAADVGKGVYWEATLIYNHLYDAKDNVRCVPVSLDGQIAVPSVLGGYTRFQLSEIGFKTPKSDYENLYRLLTRQPGTPKAPVGEIHRLPALPEQSRVTDFGQLLASVKADTQEILSILKTQPPPASTAARPHNLPPWMAPEFFIGRGAELKALCDGMDAPGALAVVQPQVVRGGGGIGKTRLVIQALWVLFLQGKCDMAFYVSAASRNDLDSQLASLGERSFLNVYHGGVAPLDMAQRRQDVIKALREKAGHWILLLDAADSPESRDATNQLLRELAGGRILITSRRDDWPVGTVRQIPLGLFSPEEARDCLRSRYWRQTPSAQELTDFDKVAQELGYLPLALTLAASYMDKLKITPARYLAAWEEKNSTLLNFAGNDPEYNRSLMAAFQLSFSELDAHGTVLLSLFAWLAPEPFPRALVDESIPLIKAISTVRSGNDVADLAKTLGEMKTLSLIELDNEQFELHKLTLACARESLSAEAREHIFNRMLDWIRISLPSLDFKNDGWVLWRRLSPHLDSIIAVGDEFGTQTPAFSYLCHKYGYWQFRQARYFNAERLLRRALAIAEKIYDAEHTVVATTLNSLAQLLIATNQLAEAEPLLLRSLAISEKSFGSEHPNVATILGFVAELLFVRNQSGAAEMSLRRALAIDEKSYGSSHPTVSRDLNNLAHLFKATNRHREAEPLLRRALEITEKSYDSDHPELARALNNLAHLLVETNRLEEAGTLLRRALAINEASYGSDHPKVATGLNNVAQLLQGMKRFKEAEPLLRRALASDEKSYSSEHPDVARDLNNLALLLQSTNRLGEAEPLMRRALAILEKSYSSEHPNVASGLNNLALLLQEMGRLGEAEALMRRALAVWEKSYSSEPSNVARVLNNLAQLLQKTGRLKEAESLMRRALVILLKLTATMGYSHPKLNVEIENYLDMLEQLSLTSSQIEEKVIEMASEANVEVDFIRKFLMEYFGRTHKGS